MFRHLNKTLVALVGAVVFPLALLMYLASLPGGGRGSLLFILLQISIVVGSVFLFAVFLARFVEQVNARRVRRWLASDEGAEWLANLSDDERAAFLAKLDGNSIAEAEVVADSDVETSVDSPDVTR